jgi:hypothetical protein
MNIHDMTWLREDDGDMFGRRVAAWLAMHRIGHAELATATGTDKWGLSRALNGRRAFPVSLPLAVSHYTGLPLTGDTVTFNPRPRPGHGGTQQPEAPAMTATHDHGHHLPIPGRGYVVIDQDAARQSARPPPGRGHEGQPPRLPGQARTGTGPGQPAHRGPPRGGQGTSPQARNPASPASQPETPGQRIREPIRPKSGTLARQNGH